jgi:LysM repeat protein
MKTIGIKLADGSFYPILEEGTAKTYQLDLTTVKDGQTKVQIDLYRSATGTMEDAEYVDTLEVSNLVPHPNGEVELHLSVGLNENNELDAKVVDEETGKQSETNVVLVSRTLAERSEPTNFELSDTGDDAVQEDDLSLEDVPEVTDNAAESAEEPSAESSAEDGFTDVSSEFTFDDFEDDTANGISEEKDTNGVVTETVDEVPFSFDSEILDEAKTEEEADDVLTGGSDTERAMPDFEEPAADFASDAATEDFAAEDVADTTVIDESESGEAVSDGAESGETLPDIGNDDMFDNDSFTTDAPDTADDIAAETVADTTESDDLARTFDTSALDEPASSEDFTLPDFDQPVVTDSTDTDNSGTETEGLTGYFDDPAFNEDPVFTERDLTTDTDVDFGDTTNTVSNSTSSSPAMDFSDLYDKETLEGDSSNYEEEEEHKTHIPMIICIICAIICVIATILVLFIVPSKYNLIKSRNTRGDTTAEATIQETAVEEVEPMENVEVIEVAEAPAAEEDKVVVAPEPEVVVPAPAPKKEKKADVKYRIRWGDTLWDIADAYYKNPWRYPKIAKYNKIKNPDLIISGTDILIPFE